MPAPPPFAVVCCWPQVHFLYFTSSRPCLHLSAVSFRDQHLAPRQPIFEGELGRVGTLLLQVFPSPAGMWAFALPSLTCCLPSEGGGGAEQARKGLELRPLSSLTLLPGVSWELACPRPGPWDHVGPAHVRWEDGHGLPTTA